MSHEPPVPPDATSPYPLETPPAKKARRKPARTKRRSPAPGTALVVLTDQDPPAKSDTAAPDKAGPIIGVGAAVALGAAAAVTGLFYAKRRSAAAARTKPARPASAKRSSSDDKAQRSGADRRRVANGQPYEVSYFARKHGLSAADARAIIEQAGNDRERANQLASRRKSTNR